MKSGKVPPPEKVESEESGEVSADGQELNHKGKLTLCANAPNDGPARCVRRAIPVFANIRQQGMVSSEPDEYLPKISVPDGYDPAVYYSTLLCAGASSDAPADCVSKAPYWLSPEEKIHLCSFPGTPPPQYHSNQPLECLSAVSNSIGSKRLTNSPKKCLGYFLSNLGLESERKSRYLLLHMCSYHGSDYPIACLLLSYCSQHP